MQSPPGVFASRLAKELSARGHRVLRINLCLGDWLQWSGSTASSYRGSYDDWRRYLSDFLIEHAVTDILYYGDRLPYHRVAHEVAKELSVRTIVYEFGYLRPDWITLERGGMSSMSHFPMDRDAIVAAARDLPAPRFNVEYPHDFLTEAFFEVLHHLSTYFGSVFYPRYNADAYYNPLLNYLSYIPRLLASGRRNRRAKIRTQRWIENRRYVLVPLQMQNDYQLRANSGFRNQHEAIDLVLRSLAASKATDLSVLFKIHPLDNGWEKWSKVVGEKARTATVHLQHQAILYIAKVAKEEEQVVAIADKRVDGNIVAQSLPFERQIIYKSQSTIEEAINELSFVLEINPEVGDQ